MQFTAEIGSRPILEAGLCDASICPSVAIDFLQLPCLFCAWASPPGNRFSPGLCKGAFVGANGYFSLL